MPLRIGLQVIDAFYTHCFHTKMEEEKKSFCVGKCICRLGFHDACTALIPAVAAAMPASSS